MFNRFYFETKLNNKFYIIDDTLPSIPQELIQKLQKFELKPYRNFSFPLFTHSEQVVVANRNYFVEVNKHVQKTHRASKFGYIEWFELPLEILKWIKNYICSDNIDISHMVLRRCDNLIPHIDGNRSFAVNYFYQTSNAITSVWNFKNQETESFYRTQKGLYFPVKYEDVELIEKIIIPPNKWVIFNTSKIHSVENVLTERKGISISYPYIFN